MAKRLKMFTVLSFIVVLFLLSACQALGGSGLKVDNEWSDPSALVLHNGTVITATGEDPIEKGAVLIQDGLITAVGPESKVTAPHDAVVIDVEGRTIMPGLIDARASDLLNRLEIEDDRINDFALEFILQPALQAGVTTVRAIGWNWEQQQHAAEYRAALETYGNMIPTVVIVGTSISHGKGSGVTHYYPHQMIGAVTSEEAQQVTERLIELRNDQVSFVMSVTQEANKGSKDGLPTLSLEQLKTIVATAHSHGKRVTGQAVFPDEAELALAAGVDELANWPSSTQPITDELIKGLVEQSVPVVSGFCVVAPRPGDDVRRFLDAGGTLVYGTYAPNCQSLTSAYLEFRRMDRFGMTAMEIVEAATINAARAVGLGEVTGSLEPGKEADILVIDGDLFENILAVKNVAYVINNGELIVTPEGAP